MLAHGQLATGEHHHLPLLNLARRTQDLTALAPRAVAQGVDDAADVLRFGLPDFVQHQQRVIA